MALKRSVTVPTPLSEGALHFLGGDGRNRRRRHDHASFLEQVDQLAGAQQFGARVMLSNGPTATSASSSANQVAARAAGSTPRRRAGENSPRDEDTSAQPTRWPAPGAAPPRGALAARSMEDRLEGRGAGFEQRLGGTGVARGVGLGEVHAGVAVPPAGRRGPGWPRPAPPVRTRQPDGRDKPSMISTYQDKVALDDGRIDAGRPHVLRCAASSAWAASRARAVADQRRRASGR